MVGLQQGAWEISLLGCFVACYSADPVGRVKIVDGKTSPKSLEVHRAVQCAAIDHPMFSICLLHNDMIAIVEDFITLCV